MGYVERIEELAQLADPNELWRRRGLDRQKFTDEEKRQLDTAVALRRHAAHVSEVAALQEGKSLLITPLFIGNGNSRRVSVIDTPPRKDGA